MKLPNIFVPRKKGLKSELGKLLNPSVKIQLECGKFELIHALTYAEGVAKLKEQGRVPFTFFENIEARIADYEANGENAELFKNYLDSVTSIAYKADSTKFKLILRCSRLENIKPGFNQSFIPVDYNNERGLELDSKKGKYNQSLTREEAKGHEFWLAAMNGDKKKLAKYVDIWFDKTGAGKGMSVCLRGDKFIISRDELWALVLYDDYDSDALGFISLGYDARFVLGAQ